MTKEALFLDKIFETEILMDLHPFRSPGFENYIFSGCSMCEPVINITQKHITTEASNLEFHMYILCRHAEEFKHIISYRRNFSLAPFSAFRLSQT